MPGKILIATDFSDGAAAAVQEGRVLAARLGADVELLHVIDVTTDDPNEGQHAESDGSGGPNVVVREGTPWLEIVRRALETDPLAVVVGSNGTRGSHPISPGTTTLKLLVRCPVPVLVVPTRIAGQTPSADPTRTSFIPQSQCRAR